MDWWALARGIVGGEGGDAPWVRQAHLYGTSSEKQDRYERWRDNMPNDELEELYEMYLEDHPLDQPDGHYFDDWLEDYYWGHRD